MKDGYITKIQSKLKRASTIRTRVSSWQILDGSYHSVYRGSSMNFDELREYIPGDDVKNISWKASARNQKLLVKQYVGEKKHNILLAMDTNKRMLADTKLGEQKRKVALLGAGMLEYMTNLNGDYNGAIFFDKDKIHNYPFRVGLDNIEGILKSCHKSISIENESSIEKLLDFIIHNNRRQMIVLVVTDLVGLSSISKEMILRLRTCNDVRMLIVTDANPYGKQVFGLDKEEYLPTFFSKDKKLLKEYDKWENELKQECEEKCKSCGVKIEYISDENQLEIKLRKLMEAR